MYSTIPYLAKVVAYNCLPGFTCICVCVCVCVLQLIRARVHRFKQRELVVILNSLVLVYSQRDRVPAAGQLDMLWLDEVARWTANKMFNARYELYT